MADARPPGDETRVGQGEDRTNKVGAAGGWATPIAVVVVGAVLGWLGNSAQREYAAVNARTAQVNAVSTLLDALTDDDCESSARKRTAIRLVYHVLADEEAASELLLAVQDSAAGGSCAALVSEVFTSRLAATPSDLSAAVVTLVGTTPGTATAPVEATAELEEVRQASRVLQASHYAPLVIPAVVEAALTSDDPQATQNVGQLLQDDATIELARRNPYLANIGQAFLESEVAAIRGVPSEAAPIWREQLAPP